MRGARSIVPGRRLRLLALLTFGIVAVLAPHCTDAVEIPTAVAASAAEASAFVQHADTVAMTGAQPASGPAADLLGACLSLLLALAVTRVRSGGPRSAKTGRGRIRVPAVREGPRRHAASPLSLGILRT